MATFGRNSTSTSYTNAENVVVGSVFTLVESGVVTSITADLNVTLSQKNMKCQIYRHSDLKLMAETAVKSVAIAHAQITFTFASNPTLPADDYILSVYSASGSGYGYISYAAGSTNQGHTDSATYPTTPDPMVPTHNNNVYNIYATYEPSPSPQFFTRYLAETIAFSETAEIPIPPVFEKVYRVRETLYY